MQIKKILVSILIPLLAYNGLLLINSSYLRQAYVESVVQIPVIAQKKLANGEPLEVVTRWAVNKRNQLKHDIREKGSYLDKKWAENRNLKKYNNALGPSYTWLFDKIQADKNESAEVVNQKIIAGSGKTNIEINNQIKQKGWLGFGLVGLMLVLFISRIYTAKTHPKRNIILPELGRVAGGLIGGTVGVHLGVSLSEQLAYPEQLANFGTVGSLTCCVLTAFIVAFVLDKSLRYATKTLQKKAVVPSQKQSVLTVGWLLSAASRVHLGGPYLLLNSVRKTLPH